MPGVTLPTAVALGCDTFGPTSELVFAALLVAHAAAHSPPVGLPCVRLSPVVFPQALKDTLSLPPNTALLSSLD
jgi:hypothetical protein